MQEFQIVELPIEAIKPYENNARKHANFDVNAIKKSIEEFGFCDPIGVWGDQNLIVEGHGRLMAAKELGMATVPCIRLDFLSDEERKAYGLAHNKTAELSKWDPEKLAEELADISDFDMSDFGFNVPAFDASDLPEAGDLEDGDNETDGEEEEPEGVYICPSCGFAFDIKDLKNGKNERKNA